MQKLQVTYSTWKQVTGLPVYYVTQNEGYSIFACGDQYFISSEVSIADDITDFESNYKLSATEVASKDDAFVQGIIVNDMRLSGTQPAMETDKRMVVVNFPADEGTFMWLAGAGDDIVNSVRGGGTEIVLEFADTVRIEPEVKTLDVEFMEWIQLHDGQITVTDNTNWALGDRWDWGVFMPATVVVPNGTNEGNCNVVNPQGVPGEPDSYIIVPALGDGAFDVDLDEAVPVPASGAGYWEFDWRNDIVSPSANPGGAGWYLLAVDAPMAYFMRRVNVPIHRAGNFDFDAYKAERIYRRWKLRLVVSKKSSGPGKLSGWIVCFREYNT